MLDRLLQRIQDLRYGNVGAAVATAAATFSLLWTVLEVAGVPGSAVTFLALLLVSTITGFCLYIYLRERQHRAALILRRPWHGPNAMNTYRSRTLGIVAPISYWATDYYIQIIKAIRQAAERETRTIQRKVVVLDVPHEEFIEVEQTLTDRLIKNVSGLILVNLKIDDITRQELLDNNTPVVNVTHQDNLPPSVCNILHDHSGFKVLLEQVLIEKRVNAAILITKELENPFKGVKSDPYRKEKRDIFVQVAQRANLAVEPAIDILAENCRVNVLPGKAYIFDVDQYHPEYGTAILSKIIEPIPPNTAFIFLADIVAIGFLVACRESGVSAKERGFRVTGFDNIKAAEWFDLSSVDYQLNVIGRIAYEKLQLALDHPNQVACTTERVATVSVVRGSSNW